MKNRINFEIMNVGKEDEYNIIVNKGEEGVILTYCTDKKDKKDIIRNLIMDMSEEKYDNNYIKYLIKTGKYHNDVELKKYNKLRYNREVLGEVLGIIDTKEYMVEV